MAILRKPSPIDPDALPPGFTLLQVAPRLEGGGVEQVTLDTALAVAGAGGRSLVASWGGRLADALERGGAELVRLPVHSRNPVTVAANAARLRSLIAARGVSLVHVRSRAPAFSAIWAARRAGVPAIATYHGIYQARSPWKRWYNGVMTRGDLTIANSTFTRDHIVAEHSLPPERIAIVPEGIDTDRFDRARVNPERIAAVRAAWGLDPADPRPVLLLAARLTGWKGQEVAIQALARFTGPDQPILVLAGKAEKLGEAEALRAAARRAGVADRVRLVGPVDDMPAAYALADLVLAPSTLPESFGRGVIEAAAMQRPVLASPLGGPAETILDGETGWLVASGDPDAWARAVEAALATPPEARERMGRSARDRVVRCFSLGAMTTATFQVYRRLLDANG
ncbi:MAG: glycosyl transferase [Caulobacteraceae bacterium]|nr:glycosyl transferase [Caulobacteraceae bacterium]